MKLDDIQSNSGFSLPFESNNIAQIITDILPYLFGAAGIILLLNIIVSGYQMMTSAGEPKAMQAAQAKITTSIIGIVIIFVSFWAVQLILKFFGIGVTIFG